jgi:hypothetical protein
VARGWQGGAVRSHYQPEHQLCAHLLWVEQMAGARQPGCCCPSRRGAGAGDSAPPLPPPLGGAAGLPRVRAAPEPLAQERGVGGQQQCQRLPLAAALGPGRRRQPRALPGPAALRGRRLRQQLRRRGGGAQGCLQAQAAGAEGGRTALPGRAGPGSGLSAGASLGHVCPWCSCWLSHRRRRCCSALYRPVHAALLCRSGACSRARRRRRSA